MGDHRRKVEREQIRQDVVEHWIGRRKQRREHDEHGHGERHAEQRAPHIAETVVLRQLVPLNVAEQQHESAEHAGRACRDNAADQIEGIPLRDHFSLQARRR